MSKLKIRTKKASFGDVPLLVCIFAMVAFGCVMIYSASSYVGRVEYDDEFFFVKKQAIGAVLGAVAFVGVQFFDYEKLAKLKYPAVIVAAVMLILVFVPGVGVTNYGATRWIGFGGLTVQPSEVAKYAFVIFAAAHFSKYADKVKTFRGVLPVLGVGIGFCVLIIAEPNMSITVCVGAVLIIMLFVGGMKTGHLAALALPAAAAVPVMIIAEPYRLKRLAAFIDPWKNPLGEGYQLIQSYYALGSGGFFGVGLFNSRQKYLFLPFAESDFILSVIGEELGYAGCLLLFALFAALIYLGYAAAVRADTPFKCYLAAGITSVIAVQTLVNAAVVSGAIPPTGLPLPFISAGGSSLVAFMAACGLLLNVSARGATHKQEKNHSM